MSMTRIVGLAAATTSVFADSAKPMKPGGKDGALGGWRNLRQG